MLLQRNVAMPQYTPPYERDDAAAALLSATPPRLPRAASCARCVARRVDFHAAFLFADAERLCMRACSSQRQFARPLRVGLPPVTSMIAPSLKSIAEQPWLLSMIR